MNIIVTTEEKLTELIYSSVNLAIDEFASNASQKIKPIKRTPAKVKDACDFLRCSTVTLHNLTKSGQLKSFNIGRSVRYDWDDLEAFVDQQKGE